jgi:hypothetical protein
MDDDFRVDGSVDGNCQRCGWSGSSFYFSQGGNCNILGTFLRLRCNQRRSPPRITGQAGE